MNIQTVTIGDSFRAMDISLENFLLRAVADDRSGLADIVIRTGDKEVTLKSAADARVLGQTAAHQPGATAIGADARFARLSDEIVLILGVRDVFAIVPRTGDAQVVFRRFRGDSDDHGFYREEIVDVPDGCVIVYEGGVARVTIKGKLLWHSPVTWNDQLDCVQNNALHFVRAERDGTITRWSIDLGDGSRH